MPAAERRSSALTESLKSAEKIGFIGGLVVYVLSGVPVALAITALSGGAYLVTKGIEK